ncbi:MAG: FapA family protein [Calditrichia bacterium]
MPKFDEKSFTFSVDDNWMTGVIQVKDFSNPQALLVEIKEFLTEKKIKRIIKENLVQCLKEKQTGQKYVIAKGIQPEPTIKEYYELLVDLDEQPRPMERMDGGVDFKELYIPNLVKLNQPIMRLIPTKQGKNGLNIKSEVIAPPEKSISSFLPSEDLKPDENNPGIFLAAKAGLVKIQDKRVIIINVLKVNGDVDFRTGNIRFPGNVVVSGDVKSGFKIFSEGNVEVLGSVEDAEIVAEGDVKVRKGFVGNGEGIIKSKGTVEITYGLNQQIKCRNLIFHKEIINCKVNAGESVVSRRGLIIGGEVKADYKVEVRQIGHEEATKAFISVGSKKDLIQRKKEMEQKIHQLNEEYKKIKDTLYNLFRKKVKNQLSDEEEALLNNLEEKKKSIPDEITILEKNITELNQSFEKIKNANITVFGIIYPGNIIELFSERLDPRKSYNNVLVRYKDEQLNITRL